MTFKSLFYPILPITKFLNTFRVKITFIWKSIFTILCIKIIFFENIKLHDDMHLVVWLSNMKNPIFSHAKKMTICNHHTHTWVLKPSHNYVILHVSIHEISSPFPKGKLGPKYIQEMLLKLPLVKTFNVCKILITLLIVNRSSNMQHATFHI